MHTSACAYSNPARKAEEMHPWFPRERITWLVWAAEASGGLATHGNLMAGCRDRYY